MSYRVVNYSKMSCGITKKISGCIIGVFVGKYTFDGCKELNHRRGVTLRQAYFMRKDDYRWYYPKLYLSKNFRCIEGDPKHITYENFFRPNEVMVSYIKPKHRLLYRKEKVEGL